MYKIVATPPAIDRKRPMRANFEREDFLPIIEKITPIKDTATPNTIIVQEIVEIHPNTTPANAYFSRTSKEGKDPNSPSWGGVKDIPGKLTADGDSSCPCF